MHVEAEHGTVLMKMGARFANADAERLERTVASLAPFTRLIFDFTEVREFHDSAILSLSNALRGCGSAQVTVRGLGLHQSRLLRYLHAPPPAAIATAGR